MEKYSTVKVNSRILEAMSDLTFIREKIAELVENPSEDVAEEIEGLFEKYDQDNAALRNSVVILAKAITGTDVNEEGQEFDVVPDKNGLKLS